MSFETIYHIDGSSIDSSSTTKAATEVLVAELYDGRLASIAFHPTWHLFNFITGITKEEADASHAQNEIDEPMGDISKNA